MIPHYNDLVSEDEMITVRWVQRVEKENKVPTDLKRRWIITTLLGIPPASFGLQALSSLASKQEVFPINPTTVPTSVDIQFYSARVKTLWSSWASLYAHQSTELFEEMVLRIAALEYALLYGKASQKAVLALLLCHYLLLFGNILRDQGYLQSAHTYLNKAVALASNYHLPEYLAKAFYLRGYVLFDQWGIQQDKSEHRVLQQATHDFSAALQLVEQHQDHHSFENIPLSAAIVAELGLAHAYQSQDRDDRIKAFRWLDQSEKLVHSPHFQRDWFFLQVNAEWTFIDKAEAFLAVRWPKSALTHLHEQQREADLHRRRYIYTDMLEAKAHLMQGHLDLGVTYLENTLDAIENTQPLTFLASIVLLHNELKHHDSYKTSPEVARLSVKLLRVQHPELFSKDR